MSSEETTALVSKLQNQIHEHVGRHVTEEPFGLVDFPDIRNVGDSAIWLGEIAYLEKWFGRKPAYVSRTRDFSAKDVERVVPSAGTVFIHGGGNFGDIWPSHQRFREHVLERLADRRVVQFPQSIHFQSESGISRAARAISKHKNFTLLVRDEESLELSRKHFDCAVFLCPDMAFCIGEVDPIGAPQYPVLAMLRQDKEKARNYDIALYPEIPIDDWITEVAAKVRMVKTRAALESLLTFDRNRIRAAVFDAAANNRFDRGVRQLSRAQAIVTDRLHVHIISLLLGKPHAILDNSYGKIGRFMSAFGTATDLAYRAQSLDDAVDWARQQAQS